MTLAFASDRETGALVVIFDPPISTDTVDIAARDRQTGRFLGRSGWTDELDTLPITRIDHAGRAFVDPAAAQVLYDTPFVQLDVPSRGLSQAADWPFSEKPPRSPRKPTKPHEATAESGLSRTTSDTTAEKLPPRRGLGRAGQAIAALAVVAVLVAAAMMPRPSSDAPASAAVARQEEALRARERELLAKEKALEAAAEKEPQKVVPPPSVDPEQERAAAQLAEKARALAEKERALNARNTEVSAREQQLESERSQLGAKEQAVTAREASVSTREVEVFHPQPVTPYREPMQIQPDPQPQEIERPANRMRSNALPSMPPTEMRSYVQTAPPQRRCSSVAIPPLGGANGYGWGPSLGEAKTNAQIDCNQKTGQVCRVSSERSHCP